MQVLKPTNIATFKDLLYRFLNKVKQLIVSYVL